MRSKQRILGILLGGTLLFYGSITFISNQVLLKSPIYIAGAYLINEELLRVIFIANCTQTFAIYANIEPEYPNYKTFFKAQLYLIDEKNCPFWFSSPTCSYHGFYAEFQLPHKFIGQEVVLSAGSSSQSVRVPVQRAVEPKKRKHFLAICLPALFYYDDPVQMIQLFEHWLINGATKFFLYWRSFSSDIKQIIQIYQQSGVDIELVNWPHFPNIQADTLLFYSGQIVSINDCLHRARAQAEFAAVIDMDEFLIGKVNFTQLLQEIPMTSAGVSIFRKAAYENNHNKAITSSNLRNLSFSWLEAVDLQLGLVSDKLVLRPENVRRCAVHMPLETEKLWAETGKLSTDQVIVVHLRNTDGLYGRQESARSNIMSSMAANIAKNWQHRSQSIDNSTIAMIDARKDPAKYSQVMEMCLKNLHPLEITRKCFTASHCISLLKNNSLANWQYPPKEWIEL